MEKNKINSKIYLLFIPIICIIAFICTEKFNNKSISMKDAYYIAYKAVQQENSLVLLESITSADPIDNSDDINAGENGLRRCWSLDFAVPNSSDHWIVTIKDLKIKDLIPLSGIIEDKSNLIAKKEF